MRHESVAKYKYVQFQHEDGHSSLTVTATGFRISLSNPYFGAPPWVNHTMQRLYTDYADIEGHQVLVIIDIHSKWIAGSSTNALSYSRHHS